MKPGYRADRPFGRNASEAVLDAPVSRVFVSLGAGRSGFPWLWPVNICPISTMNVSGKDPVAKAPIVPVTADQAKSNPDTPAGAVSVAGPTPEQASEYVPPHPLPAPSEHRTIETKPVRLRPDIDPHRAATRRLDVRRKPRRTPSERQVAIRRWALGIGAGLLVSGVWTWLASDGAGDTSIDQTQAADRPPKAAETPLMAPAEPAPSSDTDLPVTPLELLPAVTTRSDAAQAVPFASRSESSATAEKVRSEPTDSSHTASRLEESAKTSTRSRPSSKETEKKRWFGPK
jgi:hypothetical protein